MTYVNNASYVNYMSYVNDISYVCYTSYVCRLYELYELCKSYEYFYESFKVTWNRLKSLDLCFLKNFEFLC